MEMFVKASFLRMTPLAVALLLMHGSVLADHHAAAPAVNAPDVAQALSALQARLAALEARNAELEKRLSGGAEPTEAALRQRVEALESEIVALHEKPEVFPRLAGVNAGASLLMVAQRGRGTGVSESQLSARADIEVELPMGSIGEAEGKLFAHFRAGEGDGVAAGGFATTNAVGGFGTSRPALMQAWYQLDVPVGGRSGELGQVEITVGKIDPFGFFDGNNAADDESEQFLNLAFIHNPQLDASGDIGVGSDGASPGVRVAYVSDINGGNHITASLGLFGAGKGGDYIGTFSKPLTLAQLEYAGKPFAGLEGAYRVYAWNNSRAFDGVNDVDANGEFDDIQEAHRGWGFSLDQQVTPHVTVFSRYGHSTRGVLAFDRAFTVGAQVAGGAWGRADDHLGIAYGVLKSSNEYETAGSGRGNETLAELYYAWRANDHLQLSPGVQRIHNTAGSGTDVTVWSLRAKASF